MALPEPSKKLAGRLLSELEYGEQIVGYDMSSSTGTMRRSLYSLQEVYDLLRIQGLDSPLIRGGGGVIGYIDFRELTDWIQDVLGDDDLASAVREIARTDDSYYDQLHGVRGLISERLDQARAVAA